MAYTVQLTVDSADPHVLADWWAETLRWQVEAQDEAFIRQMIAEGHATEADTRVYRGSLVWREGAAILPQADADSDAGPDAAPVRGGLRMFFQQVPEAKTVKNRLHLDVRIGDDDPEQVRAALVERGATVLHSGRQGPHTWVTMADPEGNEFCV